MYSLVLFINSMTTTEAGKSMFSSQLEISKKILHVHVFVQGDLSTVLSKMLSTESSDRFE